MYRCRMQNGKSNLLQWKQDSGHLANIQSVRTSDTMPGKLMDERLLNTAEEAAPNWEHEADVAHAI